MHHILHTQHRGQLQSTPFVQHEVLLHHKITIPKYILHYVTRREFDIITGTQ